MLESGPVCSTREQIPPDLKAYPCKNMLGPPYPRESGHKAITPSSHWEFARRRRRTNGGLRPMPVRRSQADRRQWGFLRKCSLRAGMRTTHVCPMGHPLLSRSLNGRGRHAQGAKAAWGRGARPASPSLRESAWGYSRLAHRPSLRSIADRRALMHAPWRARAQ